jgi:hypothetical protein
MFIDWNITQLYMAKAKTGSFYLTETVTLAAASPDGTIVQGDIDLGAYVNVASGQAVAITSVDFVTQVGSQFSPDVSRMINANGSFAMQLSDLNPGTLMLRADDQALIASGGLNIDQANNVATHTQDLYPDNFGPANLSEAFLVVNDSLYLTGGVFGAAVDASDVEITARIRCNVVKLTTKDWMAIAIQSTASDN